jgi:DNA mismatch endonuclease (patch repair protein)
VRELPGRPDLVLPKHRAVIFVHGCFWHGHECPLFKWPSTRPEFWREKIGKNAERDARSIQLLRDSGWRVAVLWECAVRSKDGLASAVQRLATWVDSGEARVEIRG